MKIVKIIFLFFFFSTIDSLATSQTPDYLLLEKDTLFMHSNPLEDYFKRTPLPANLQKISSSGNWRGYIAYFKFVDNKLVVENIYIEDYKKISNKETKFFLTSIYKDVFGETENFSCDFYSGLLICPYGELVRYVHMGYSSTYEFYKLFEIKQGENLKNKQLTGDEFIAYKVEYYKYFKTTEEFRISKEKLQEASKEVAEMSGEISNGFDRTSKKKKRKPKENIYLKQKEEEYKSNKMLDSFMFYSSNDFMKTIDIPKYN